MHLLVTIVGNKFRTCFVLYVYFYVSLCGLLPPVTTNGSCPFGFPGSFGTSLQASLLHSGPSARIEQQVPSRQTLDGRQCSRSHEVSTMNGDVHRQYHTAVGPQTPCSLYSFALIGFGIPKTLVMKNPKMGMAIVRMATMMERTTVGSENQLYIRIQEATGFMRRSSGLHIIQPYILMQLRIRCRSFGN